MFVQVVTVFFYNMGVIIFAVGQELASHCSFSYQGFFFSCVKRQFFDSILKNCRFWCVYNHTTCVYNVYYVNNTIILQNASAIIQ